MRTPGANQLPCSGVVSRRNVRVFKIHIVLLCYCNNCTIICIHMFSHFFGPFFTSLEANCALSYGSSPVQEQMGDTGDTGGTKAGAQNPRNRWCLNIEIGGFHTIYNIKKIRKFLTNQNDRPLVSQSRF